MKDLLPPIKSEIKKCFVESINLAVGDAIKEDVQSKGLVTGNGNPGRIWDLLHTELVKRLKKFGLVAKPTQRGAWAILPIVDATTHLMSCCMRETTFAQLSKRERRKKARHYSSLLAYVFNRDLPILQGTLFDYENSDSEKLNFEESVARIFHDLEVNAEVVERFALILFNSSCGQLTSVRICAVNCNLEIVAQQSWTEYIPAFVSSVVEIRPNKEPTNAKPITKHQLSNKAKKRIAERQRD